jgi:ABC-type transporter Mla MlaB component
LLAVSAAQRGAKVARALPAGTETQRKAKIDAWRRLTDQLAGDIDFGEVTLQEVERKYEHWLDDMAKNKLLLAGVLPRATLTRLVEKIERVQSLKLKRVELRACNIGGFPEAMKAVKELFGCNKLLAPRCWGVLSQRSPGRYL